MLQPDLSGPLPDLRYPDGKPGPNDPPKPELVPALPDYVAPPPALPWYRKHFFKRAMGGLTVLAAAASFVPDPVVAGIGKALGVLCGAVIGWAGIQDAVEKKKQGIEQTDNLINALVQLLKALFEFFKAKKGVVK